MWANQPTPKRALPPTVFVSPFEVVNSNDDSTQIGVGLAHAIRTNLSRIVGLSVLSKAASAGQLDKEGRGPQELARELGATILLEGEVLRSGPLIQVLARLIDVENGRVIWGEQYRNNATDLFTIQDEVCANVAAVLRVNISNDVRDQIARPATNNIEAFEFYSKGRAFIERYDVKANINYAIQMFEEALNVDSQFALAQAGLSEAYWRKYVETRDATWVTRAIAAGDRALVLDPQQAESPCGSGDYLSMPRVR